MTKSILTYMKNISIVAVFAAALALISCRHEEQVNVVLLNETEVELVKGSTLQLVPTTRPEGITADFEWWSSNPEYVSVSEDGLVKAEKIYFENATDTESSSVAIYCKCQGGAATCMVKVLPLQAESAVIKVLDWDSNEALKMAPMTSKTLELVFTPADADVDYDAIEWKTTGFEYVAVKKIEGTAQAVITSSMAGSAYISARYGAIEEPGLNVIVTPVPATSVTILNKTEMSRVLVGRTLQFAASYAPENATVEVAWKIASGAEHASINSETGLFTAKSPGTVTVQAIAGSVNDSVEVEVVEE